MIVRYQKLNFFLEAIDTLGLPDYKGSTFRGGFGNAFRRVVCALKRKDCMDCLLKSRCVYAYIFETSPPETTEVMGMNKYEKVPHPFVIEPPEEKQRIYEPGEKLSFSLLLIGRAVDYLPYFIYTFEELGKTGLGKGRGKYRLLSVTDHEKPVYSFEDKTLRTPPVSELILPDAFSFGSGQQAVTLRFLTPARIVYQRELVSELAFHILMRSLLRRLCLLYYFHCESREPLWDHKHMIAEAEKVVIKDDSLQWHDWERYSARQGVRMKLGGVLGDITYMDVPDAFMPVLMAGELFHVGKGTSFGLGKFQIV